MNRPATRMHMCICACVCMCVCVHMCAACPMGRPGTHVRGAHWHTPRTRTHTHTHTHMHTRMHTHTLMRPAGAIWLDVQAMLSSATTTLTRTSGTATGTCPLLFRLVSTRLDSDSNSTQTRLPTSPLAGSSTPATLCPHTLSLSTPQAPRATLSRIVSTALRERGC